MVVVVARETGLELLETRKFNPLLVCFTPKLTGSVIKILQSFNNPEIGDALCRTMIYKRLSMVRYHTKGQEQYPVVFIAML